MKVKAGPMLMDCYLAVVLLPDGQGLGVVRPNEDQADQGVRLMCAAQVLARAVAEFFGEESNKHLSLLAEAAGCLDAAVQAAKRAAELEVQRVRGEA